jgi:hypothetical protein
MDEPSRRLRIWSLGSSILYGREKFAYVVSAGILLASQKLKNIYGYQLTRSGGPGSLPT